MGIIALWIVSVLLAIAFLLAGTPKLLHAAVWVDKFDGWGYGQWFLGIIGGLELAGAILLLIPRMAVAGVALLGVIMLGAGYTHLANGEGLEVIRPLIFLGLLVAVGWARWKTLAKTLKTLGQAPEL